MSYVGKGIASLLVEFDIYDNAKLRDMPPEHYICHRSSQVAYVNTCSLCVSLQTPQLLQSRRCTIWYPSKLPLRVTQFLQTPVLNCQV